jgi:hypothetical protein
VIRLFLVLFFIVPAWAAVQVRLHFPEGNIQQGAMIPVALTVESSLKAPLILKGLPGKKLGDSLYFHKLSSPLKKEGVNSFEAQAQVIFLKVPDSNSVTSKISDEEVVINWNSIQVLATEPPKELLFGHFEIPEKDQIFFWISVILLSLVLLFLSFKIYRKYRSSKQQKSKMFALKERLSSATKYEEVVGIWQEKSLLLQNFPQVESEFKKLETVLFKYQFKPHQTEDEKKEVMNAYKAFLDSTREALRGI